MTGTNFSNWYNASEGTFIASASVLNTGSRRGVYTASDGTNNNRIYLNTATGGAASHFIATPAGTQADVVIGSIAINTVFRDAFAYSENNASAALDGVLGTTDTAVILPSVNQFRLGARGDNNIPLNGHLRNITYYPIRLTTDQLQALTV
jgi:hypothetical protein